ncbi:MAG: hypothetical protein PHS53_01290 [Candidatus Pacebacteria bacterium]|nr:hypothetical protein [Candidatus Paceibacterota bacterium]MDD5356767.1 hypothetical protein [Candidatus Paceibacterota bacterium]
MKKGNNRGFIRLIILILVVLIALSYLGFDVKKIIYSPTVTKIASLIWSLLVLIFNLLITILKTAWVTVTQGLKYTTNLVQNIKTP